MQIPHHNGPSLHIVLLVLLDLDSIRLKQICEDDAVVVVAFLQDLAVFLQPEFRVDATDLQDFDVLIIFLPVLRVGCEGIWTLLVDGAKVDVE
jgi:hypothetical protein